MRVYNVIITCTCVLLFTGCNLPSTELSREIPTATEDAIALPIAAYTATTALTPEIVEPVLVTATVEVNTGECLTLLVPSEGVVYPLDQNIKFTWIAMPEAEKYLLEITNTTGWLLSIETAGINYEVTAGMFPGAMAYSWTVVVFDSEGGRVCQAGPQNFSIAIKKSVPTDKPDKGEGGGSREGSGEGDKGGEGGGGDTDE